jgi:transcriptional regulator with XRE-family HTH domain
MRAKNITAKQFAEEIGIQPSGMSHILGGRNNPSLEFAMKVLRRYPEIDANWLLLGRGAMYGGEAAVQQPVAEPQVVDMSGDEPLFESSDGAAPLWGETSVAAPADGRRVVRMLLMYSDNTFSEYLPR